MDLGQKQVPTSLRLGNPLLATRTSPLNTTNWSLLPRK